MNSHALLTAQGWRGKGHSLHRTDDSVGLAKPLLLSRKDDTKGLGTTQHFTSDQWWMNAFEEQLKGLDTTQEGKVTQTLTTGKLNAVERGSLGKYYLYTSFVRGGFLEGSLPGQKQEEDSSAEADGKRARSAEPEPPGKQDSKESKEERRARKEARRIRREERAQKRLSRRLRKADADESVPSGDPDDETRQRRARKHDKERRRQDKKARRSRHHDDKQR